MKQLTTAEAAFVVGAPLPAFKKTVERAPVEIPTDDSRGRNLRVFVFADLVFLHAYPELKEQFTRNTQLQLYEALRRRQNQGNWKAVRFGKHQYDLDDHYRVVRDRIEALQSIDEQIDTSGREALIKGTKIEAHRIAALLNHGMKVEEVLVDYPSLSKEQVIAAQAYAVAHPKPGRPYPKTTAKAAMRNIDLGRLDEVD